MTRPENSSHWLTRQVVARLIWTLCPVLGLLNPIPSGGADEPLGPADPAIYGIEPETQHYEHWAFLPLMRKPIPAVSGENSTHPLDRWIGKSLAERGLSRNPPADPRTWLRRVTLDLTGLNPTPSEIDEFLNDSTPDARARVVDRLLADPGYGVRWGRRWLDVVRFAETNGYERDGGKPNAWRYRDWVIQSLNADKPYDRLLTEQLAGDELPDRSAETLIATTFLRLGTWDDEPADPLVDRYDQLDDVVGTVTTAFLGLTLRCARCHNHKFEPLSQLDYAGMLAVFQPLQRPQNGRTDLDVPVGTDQELADHRTATARQEAAIQGVQQQLASLQAAVRERYFARGPRRLKPEAFAAQRKPVGERSPAEKQLADQSAADFQADLKELQTPDEQRQQTQFEAALKLLQEAAPAPLPRAYIWQEPDAPPSPTLVFRRGNPATPAGVVEPAVPRVLAKAVVPAAFSPAPPSSATPGTTRRRLALARWMTDPNHPLAARVIVNRLWQGHFGEGLVNSENDFGVMGSPPSHPELLDWLATRLIDSGWSLKTVHRDMVLSETYAQSSDWREVGSRIDVDNRLLWRFPYRRLEAEAVRDTVLQSSGQLSRQMGGPGVYPRIHRSVLEGQSRPGDGWGAFDPAAAARRSIYVHVKRSLLVPELELLDLADTTSSCEQRVVSTIPTQALTLLNGEFFNEQARLLAGQLRTVPADSTGPAADALDEALIQKGYRLTLGRSANAEELTASQQFLERQRAQLRAESGSSLTAADLEQRALAAWCLVLFNLNEFAYVD